MSQGWIGVDLDGTLAHYDHWRGVEHIGKPIPTMVERVQIWLAEGKDVRIFTARVSGRGSLQCEQAEAFIRNWCLVYIGRWLPITCQKDFAMIELWDDRCVQVVPNTGTTVAHLLVTFSEQTMFELFWSQVAIVALFTVPPPQWMFEVGVEGDRFNRHKQTNTCAANGCVPV